MCSALARRLSRVRMRAPSGCDSRDFVTSLGRGNAHSGLREEAADVFVGTPFVEELDDGENSDSGDFLERPGS
jgi:hypothetical protein